MAARLGEDGNRQALAHFITSSPWDPAHVRARLAWRMHEAIGPEALIVDDTGFLKDGDASACVSRQYTGTAGKVTNCQVGVSLHLANDRASAAVNWRLFLPASWDPDSPEADADKIARRGRCGIPAQAGHVEKWQLALDMIDETRSWGIDVPLVVADAGYGDAAAFRLGLEERKLPYAVGISSRHTAQPAEPGRRFSSPIRTRHGNDRRTRTRTGCCASTSRRAPISPAGRSRTSKPSPWPSTTGPAKSWVGGRRPRSSKNSYARCNSPVLQRLVELAQYTSRAFADACCQAGVRQSMSAIGSSADNALAESFNATLKRETLQGRKTWTGEREARLDAFRWLNRYNTRRHHSRLGQRSPIVYETALGATSTTLAQAA
ncbi:hypothetical protein QFZ76_009986 [Streptomyces sp. V4I2]|nr:hypothetical protein [Streptomyces sp. V4I2]